MYSFDFSEPDSQQEVSDFRSEAVNALGRIRSRRAAGSLDISDVTQLPASYLVSEAEHEAQIIRVLRNIDNNQFTLEQAIDMLVYQPSLRYHLIDQQGQPYMSGGSGNPVATWRNLFSRMSSDQKRQFARVFGPKVYRDTDDLNLLMDSLKPKPKIKRVTPRYRSQGVKRRSRASFDNAYLK